MYRVRIVSGSSPKLLPYLLQSIKELSRRGLINAAVCQGAADLTLLPRGSLPPREDGGLLLTVDNALPDGLRCGFSGQDALSLSSIRGHSALLSLQRSLYRLDGALLEMQEIPVTLRRPLRPEPEALLLAASACLLLGGVTDRGILLP